MNLFEFGGSEMVIQLDSTLDFVIVALAILVALLCIANLQLWLRRNGTLSTGAQQYREKLTGMSFSLLETDSLDERDGYITESSSENAALEGMAPPEIAWNTRAARLGEVWTSTLYVTGYPDHPLDGYLSALFTRTDVEFDATAAFTPKNQARARDELQDAADDLQADASLEHSARRVYLEERAAEATATYKAVEGGERVFGQSLYITVRGETRKELERAVKTVRATLRERPANLDPKTAVARQDTALQSAAPVGPDMLDRDSIALGGAVGAFLASPHNATVLENGGVEVGLHKDTKSPIVIDPFAREDGYATFRIGDPGSGKSFAEKQSFLRAMEQREDRIGVILEPLTGWAGVAKAVGAKRITVGGSMGLNPLELRPTPERVRRKLGDDASPLKERRERAMSFFTNFFALRNVGLDDRLTTLELVIEEAYSRTGITEDPETHGRDSPTIRNLLDILEEVASDSGEFVLRSMAERAKLESDAVWLLDQLRPFAEGGQFENLGRASEFDIQDEKFIYLDLGQHRGNIGGHTSLLMELLISLVYERAKETEKEVVFVVDEARYLLKDAATLSFMETIFRHHRHHDLSIRLVTQTLDEFYQHDIAKMVLDQCSVKQFHKLDAMDEYWADVFGLNQAQMQFIQDAIPGNDEHGYSQALLGIDGEWRGVEIRSLPLERQVIDYDPEAFNSRRPSSGAKQ